MLLVVLAAFAALPGGDVSGEPAGERTVDGIGARVKDCRIVTLEDSARCSVVYTEAAIKNAKDRATLIVGVDARWLVTLAILEHGNDPLGFKHIKTLRLIVHSPAAFIGSGRAEEPSFRSKVAVTESMTDPSMSLPV